MCLSIEVNHPDRVLAKGEHLNYKWIVTHNSIGYRCGYVRIPRNHPWYAQECDLDVDVHGGITFAEHDVPCDNPGDDTDWWIGFDCAHACDAPDPALPALLQAGEAIGRTSYGEIRTQEYVEEQCKSLCEQVANAKLGPVAQ
jgi:hypothetical protein